MYYIQHITSVKQLYKATVMMFKQSKMAPDDEDDDDGFS